MIDAIHLVGKVHRRGAPTVLVPLNPLRPTLFLEEGEPVPEGLVCIWLESPAAPARGDRDLQQIIEVLWPAGHEVTAARLQESRRQDNRLDMETHLFQWADLITGVISWWNTLDPNYRSARLQALASWDPLLSTLLHWKLPAAAQTAGPRTGTAPWTSFADLFLQPRTKTRPADEAALQAWCERTVDEILGESGGLSRVLGPRFQPRAGQMDMALRIHAALERHENLMVEAGTGIGKSVAYLTPALLRGALDGERTIVSTFTKALQNQLLHADLPLLQRLGYPGTVRLLLGRNNYLCARQLRRALLEVPADENAARAQLTLALWSRQSESGLREELTGHPAYAPHWELLFDSLEPCSPHICHRDPPCFVVAARRSARDAHVVVVNHSLLMMDLKSQQTLLGPSRILVVDEAHQLPGVATRALSRWIARERLEVYRNLTGERPSEGALREVLVDLVAAATGTSEETSVNEAAARVDAAITAFLHAFDAWFESFQTTCGARLTEGHARAGRHRYHDGDETFGEVRQQSQALLEASEELDVSLRDVLKVTESVAEDVEHVAEEREGLRSLHGFHRDYVEAIRFAMAADDEDWVYWVEWGGARGLDGIVAAPLTVEQPLAELWSEHYRSVVMTSATLAVAEDFHPFATSAGLRQGGRVAPSLQVASPFSFDDQALVLTSPALPEPNDPSFAHQIAVMLDYVSQRVSSRMLVLCTSYSLIDKLGSELSALWGDDDLFHTEAGHRRRLLRQRPGAPAAALAERFRQTEAAVLLATGSFWEGVDFPGDELEVLVIPRLPFAVPTEPLAQGRYDRAKRLGRDAFQEVALPEAVLRLKQGVGRLIRSESDRGVVLLLDQRLQAKSYGVTFLNSLPRHCELVVSLDEMGRRVVAFLEADSPRHRAGAG